MVLDNQQKLLIGLTVVLVLALIYRLATPFQQSTVDKLTYGRTNRIGAADAARRNKTRPPTKISAALMKTPTPLAPNIYRDPFRRPVSEAQVPEPRPPTPEPRALTPEEYAKEKLGRYKAFGIFTQGDRSSLFLQRGKQVLVVAVGDRIEGRYTIEAIEGRSVIVSTPETPVPFRFEFDELPSDVSRPFARSSASADGLTSSPGPRDTAAEESDDAFPEEDENEEAFSESDEDQPPSLPEPPPVDSPTQPFRSSGSPSRSYLPGTKPPDNNPSAAQTAE